MSTNTHDKIWPILFVISLFGFPPLAILVFYLWCIDEI